MKTAAELLLKNRASAAELLQQHELLDEEYWNEGRGARWLVGRRTSTAGKSEVFAGIFGSLVVHGDFATMRFAAYSDRPDAWARLLWMADCSDLQYYVTQKASIGMNGIGIGNAYDAEVAVTDLRAFAAEINADHERTSKTDRLLTLLREAEALADDGEHELRRFLYHGDPGWDLWEHHFGRIVSMDVIVAHAVLVRCAALLRVRHGAGGPPACR